MLWCCGAVVGYLRMNLNLTVNGSDRPRNLLKTDAGAMLMSLSTRTALLMRTGSRE